MRNSNLAHSLSLLLCLLAASSAHAGRFRLFPQRRLQSHGNETFPYRSCNTTAVTHPWQARLAYQEDRNGDTQVVIRVWANPFSHVVDLGSLDIYVPSGRAIREFNGSFTNATISIGPLHIRNFSNIVWSPHKQIIRFAGLNLSYVAGVNSSGFDISFLFKEGSMNDLCRSCPYTLFTGQRCIMGDLGFAPVIVVDGPDFVISSPSPDQQTP